ncbi:fatty acid desaturase-domain-containing protein [Rhizophagus diaphanus]|nr:fatty acid desaturase-domain-containing protein [Rhizophagus diaphanus] [Rhizophagus sp. MUCL 43196]
MIPLSARPFPEVEDEIQYDYRHPLYIGDWRKSIAYIDEDFAIDDLDEPHMKRRITILNHHPEIEQLYGYDIKTIPITIIVVLMQLIAAYIFGRILLDWDWVMIIYSYVIGGTMTQIYFAIIHEAAHCLTAPTRCQNRMVGLLANIALPLPLAMSFRRYHLEHHVFQGVSGIDPDLPLKWEMNLIRGNTLLKLLWLNLYPAIYLHRNIMKLKSPQYWEYVNWIYTAIINVLIYYFCGGRGILYLFLSLWFGYSIHPAAAHFIQEHYTFDDGQETYSYYGLLNKIFMNVGYHNEHHDFTRIPWSKLPEVRQIASEYYDHLAYHTSWLMVHWNFVTQKQFGPQSRVKRSIQDHRKGRKLLGVLKKSLNEE